MQSQVTSRIGTKPSIVKNMLVAGALSLGTFATAQAAPLLEYQASAFGQSAGENQQLAKVQVGAADVQIGGFGIYGRAASQMNIGFVIFDLNDLQNPAFLSSPQQVSASAAPTWYSINAPFTLLSGHQYAMGVVADKISSFSWGSGAASEVTTSGGLTLLNNTVGVKAGACSGGSFGGGAICQNSAPTLSSFLTGTYPDVFNTTLSATNKMSLQIAPVPEPSEWAMLMAGLAVIGVIGSRRKRKTI